MHNLSQLFTHAKAEQGTNKALAPWRDNHWQKVLDDDLIGREHEDWKYTALNDLYKIPLKPDNRISITKAQSEQVSLPVESTKVVFVNGRFSAELSDDDLGEWQLHWLNSDELIASPPIRAELFLNLTHTFVSEALSFSLPCRTVAKKPLYLLHINTHKKGGMQHYYHRVELGSEAKGQVIEQHVAVANIEQQNDLCCSRLIMCVADNAQLSHYNIIAQHDNTHHFSHNEITLNRNSQAHSHSFLLSGKLIRHHTSSRLMGEGSFLRKNSLSLPVATQTYDSRTFLNHQSPHCESKQLHKNIVQDDANAVFNGMIEVCSDALKTDGQMDNHNLLLSETAQVNAKPQLEIYADDVKCSHGCTTGALDKEQLFYLMARGISKQQALKILVFAFAAEVTDEVENPSLKEALLTLISAKLEVL